MDLSLTTFAVMSLAVVITPGPTVLLALTNGSRFGLARAGYGLLGAALSDVVLITAAALGLGALLAASASLFAVVKWTGVAYLTWLGVRMVRTAGRLEQLREPGMSPGDALHIFRKSLFVAVSNPKGYLFFTAFLPQFLVLSEPLVPQYVTLAAIFVTIDVAVMAVYAGVGAQAMRCLRSGGVVWLERGCGGLLVAMGLALAFLRRTPA